jgi:hypothetical protein
MEGEKGDLVPPEGALPVPLTEVVRCSERILAASRAFQQGDSETTLAVCQHETHGPPLKSFLFARKPDEDRNQQLAEKTFESIQYLKREFPGLSLHDRVAIIVPTKATRLMLQQELKQRLFSASPPIKLVRAADASAAVDFSNNLRSDGTQWIVLDEVSELDGLERLIVVLVDMDQSISGLSSNEMQSLRSQLYRAVTRGQMLVTVVNEHLENSMFEFLGHIRLADRSFSAKSEAERSVIGGSELRRIADTPAAKRALEGAVLASEAQVRGEETAVQAKAVKSVAADKAAPDHKVKRDKLEQPIWDTDDNDDVIMNISARKQPMFMPFKAAIRI